MIYKLKIAGFHYETLHNHLYPGDGKEAVALAACGRLEMDDEIIFLVHRIHIIPYHDCLIREKLFLDWNTESIQSLLIEAEKNNYSIMKIHSHPGGYDEFSKTDDESDVKLFNSIFGWTLNVKYHLSAILLPDGKIFSRVINDTMSFHSISSVNIISDDIKIFRNCIHNEPKSKDHDLRNIQTFGVGTINILKNLRISVIGCSGTGSPVVEQLARLGVGELVLVDPDIVESKNLNRILNATKDDAIKGRNKVDVLQRFIKSIGFGTRVAIYRSNLYDSIDAIKKVASSDIVFGCVDTVDGRHIANLISSFYLIPLFDIGVRLDADGKGGIDSINGTIHYVQPGKSSLLMRNAYTPDQLLSAGQKRKNPKLFKSLIKEGYIKNAKTESPAVISINMLYASLAVNDFLARIHPYRITPNMECAIQRFVLSEPIFITEPADQEDNLFLKNMGRGDTYPLLKLPELS